MEEPTDAGDANPRKINASVLIGIVLVAVAAVFVVLQIVKPVEKTYEWTFKISVEGGGDIYVGNNLFGRDEITLTLKDAMPPYAYPLPELSVPCSHQEWNDWLFHAFAIEPMATWSCGGESDNSLGRGDYANYEYLVQRSDGTFDSFFVIVRRDVTSGKLYGILIRARAADGGEGVVAQPEDRCHPHIFKESSWVKEWITRRRIISQTREVEFARSDLRESFSRNPGDPPVRLWLDRFPKGAQELKEE